MGETNEIFFTGDAAALQFPSPYECAAYDEDKVKAIESRLRVLSLAAKADLVIAGAHTPIRVLAGWRRRGRLMFLPLLLFLNS